MDEADFDAGLRITCLLLVIWGERSHTRSVHGDVLLVWRDFGRDATGGPIACGHYVQEEAPEETLRFMLDFFDDKANASEQAS